jgi:O-antigen/teichoic acid export membrane protein
VIVGLPVSLLPIGFTVFQSVDRWVVASAVPAATLGYYGVGTVFGLFLYMVPNTLATVLFTKQIERFGGSGNAETTETLVSRPILLSGYGMALAAGGVTLILPLFIHYLLPAYRPATRTATFQVLGNCLLFAVPLSANALIATGRHRPLFAVLAAAVGAEIVLVALFVRTRFGIDGAALAVLICDAAYGGVLAFLATRSAGRRWQSDLRRVGSYFFPFLITVPAALLLLPHPWPSGRVGEDMLVLTGRAAVLVLLCTPLCYVGARAAGLVAQFGAARGD